MSIKVVLSECENGWCELKSIWKELSMDQILECSDVRPSHFILDSISLSKAPNMLYCDISSLQPMEIYVDDEAKLTLHGLVQHYIKLSELEKNRKLNDLLDALDFNQVVIFVKSVSRAAELNKLLVKCNFPSICIHSGMSQEERSTSVAAIASVRSIAADEENIDSASSDEDLR